MMDDRKSIETWAGKLGVSPAVHPNDHIWNFVTQHPGFGSRDAAIGYYFTDGANSAAKFIGLLAEHQSLNSQPARVLEFASGYGCVTRHLCKRPEIDVVSCDIHKEAVRFLRESMQVRAILS